MLAGKRAAVDTNFGPYTRSFSGDCSSSDLETALQLVYQLFVTHVQPIEEDVERVKQILEECIRAQERDPFTVFSKWVTRIKCGNSYFFKTEEKYFIELLSQLLETKLTEALRFQHGQIYSVSVSSDFDYSKPSRTEDLCGDIDIIFSCKPEAFNALVDIALNEISRLQQHGPSEEDVSSVLEIEQKNYESALEQNYEWLFKILMSYRSRFYSSDVDIIFKDLNKARKRVRQSLNPLTAKWALQRILPNPCKDCYVAVTLIPETNPLRLLGSKITTLKPSDLAICSK